MKKSNTFIYILLVVLIWGMTENALCSKREPSYQSLLSKSSEELLKMGDKYNNDPLKADSAMMCYSIIAARNTPQASVKEKELVVRALNEMGVLNTTHYNNHMSAYQNLQIAYDLCHEIKYLKMEPYILLNIGNLYNLYEFLFPPEDKRTKAGEYYRKSFDAACQMQEWNMAISSYINFVMLNMPYGVGDEEVHQEMKHWIDDSIPKNITDWRLARHFLDGNLAVKHEDYNQARECYLMMSDDIKGEGTHDIAREEYMVLMCMTTTYFQEKRYDMAIDCANRILNLKSHQDMTDINVETFRLLSEYYSAMGDDAKASKYHVDYLENKEKLMKNIVGLVPSQLSHSLEEMNVEIDKMNEQKRLQSVYLAVAGIIIVLAVLFSFFIIRKNKVLNEKNTALYHRMKDIIRLDEERKNEKDVKYKDSGLKESQKMELFDKIKEAMDNTGEICKPTFTMGRLAEMIGTNTSYLSQTINEHYGMTFTNLLNLYRIKEACRRMEDSENYGNLTLDAISESVGFKARVTFTKAFKQHVGMLPSEYLKARKGHGI